ncbi:MAG TPA: integrase [Opitutae bacterium]|nr:integrase [Opitutae bacterium]HCV03465.1 integrase [Pseudoalteromonas sp.]|tara:strand:+ start:806 stop:2644 length:1839 start_codon:yes stop_codon:yes gene_type:complete
MTNSGVGYFDDEFKWPVEQVEAKQVGIASRDLSAYPEDIQKIVHARFTYIKWIKNRLIGGWTKKNLEPLIEAMPEVNRVDKPNWRTLARWYSAYSNTQESVLALVPKHHKKGNRLSRTETDHFFDKALERYLVTEQPSASAAYRFYRDQVILENERNPSCNLIPLAFKTFKNRIDNLPKYEVMVARFGKRLADIEYNKVEGRKKPTRVLEMVEIDHTPLHLILLDDELSIPIGRPTLTLLIDIFSHCVIGFYFGFTEPGYDSVRSALLHAMKPKDWLKEQYPEVLNDWPCHGKIETLVVDNGAEFWSESLELACQEIGVNIQYNPVAKPWLKPFVERIFGTINTKLLDVIPGKTFSNILAKHDYDPKKDAVMRFSVFMGIFHQWIVDVYHKEPDSRFNYIPALDWERGYKLLPPAPVDDEDIAKLEIVLGKTIWRTIRKGGIQYKHLSWDCDELTEYRKRYSPKANLKLMVKINPRDMSNIHVYLPELEHYIKVPCTDATGYVKGLTLQQHLVNLRLHRDFIGGNIDEVTLAKVRMSIDDRIRKEVEHVANTQRKSKATGGKALAKYQGVSSDNLKSVSATSSSKSQPEEHLTEKKIDNDNWDDFIADLDGF